MIDECIDKGLCKVEEIDILKIVYMIPKLMYSGAPKILAWLASMSCDVARDDVTIITFFESNAEQKVSENVRVVCLNIKPESSWIVRNTFGLLRAQRLLCKELKKIAPDLIVSFLSSIDYVFLIYHRLLRYKLVVSERVDPTSHVWYMKLYNKIALRFADGIVFQTDEARNYYKGTVYKKSIVINNPAFIKEDKLNLRDSSKIENTIVCTSRIKFCTKRQDLMLEAFEKVHEKHPDVKLKFYGDGEDFDRLKLMIEERKLEDSVILMGAVSDLPEKICNARVFVLTSDTEGIPNTLMEAMILGIPSVSTDCKPGGARLLIRDHVNGIVVPRNDSCTLANAINEILEDRQVAEKYSIQGRRNLERFKPGMIFKQWNNYYKKVVEK